MRTKRKPQNIRIGGFIRAQIVDKKTRRILGDSGWFKNQITNYGMANCFCAAPIGAASVQAAGLVLGSGTEPNATHTVLDGSNSDQYSAFGQSTVTNSVSARVTQSFDGGNSSMATVANVGVLAASTGSLIAGGTFASSSFGTDQTLNISYQFNYSTS